MEIYEIIDEKNRVLRVDFYNNGKSGQYKSHTYSYLRAREELQKLGRVMGLEKKIKNNS